MYSFQQLFEMNMGAGGDTEAGTGPTANNGPTIPGKLAIKMPPTRKCRKKMCKKKPNCNWCGRAFMLAELLAILKQLKRKLAKHIDLFICPKCKEPFKYEDEPEVAMGSVKCPHCEEVVHQDS